MRSFLLFFLALSLAACTAAPTPLPTQAGLPPTATSVPATVPPANSPVPQPSNTPAPVEVTALPTVPPTPAGPVRYGPSDFPANVNPLTGLVVSDPTLLDHRPLAVKVSQFPRAVRPQAGLSLADLVFEHYAEAGVTRMTAIYLGQAAPKIGSIRSARLVDIVLAESYKTLLITSGSSAGTLQRIGRSSIANRLIAESTGYDDCPPMCREGDSPSTNNLFTSAADLWTVADTLGMNTRQPLNGMVFDEAVPAGGTPIPTLHVDFQANNNVVEWRYDATTGRYTRWMDGDDIAQGGALVPHLEVLDGQQLTAANVVLLYANHVTTDIVEDYGELGHCGYEIQIWGSGPAKVFRNGQLYDVTWVRFDQEEVIGLVGADNEFFPLHPGNTWFEIVNLNSPTNTDAPPEMFRLRFKGPSQTTGCPVNQAPTP